MKITSYALFSLSFLALLALVMRPFAVFVQERMHRGPDWLALWIRLPALPPPYTLENLISLAAIFAGIITAMILFARADRRQKKSKESEV
jgi:hypothetical protein